jgi:hypothetical protein
LHIHNVLDKRNIRDREEALNTLPSNLEHAFGNTIERIQQQPQPSVEQAQIILTWATLAERQLSIDQLCEACAVRKLDKDLDARGFPSRSTFLDCCLGLVIVEKETLTVRLVHLSLQEYFNSNQHILSQSIEKGRDMIALACLTYLMVSICNSHRDNESE